MPLCGGNESKTPSEIASFRPEDTKPNSKGWWVRVIPSKFPVLHVEGSLEREGSGAKFDGKSMMEDIKDITDIKSNLQSNISTVK